MKKTFLFYIFATALLVMLSGCAGAGKASQSPPAPQPGPSDGQPSSPERKTAILFTNMETGNADAAVREDSYEYAGDLTPETLASGLTGLTGLDFFITASTVSDGFVIDWAANSTLIANLDDREQKDEFHHFDADSMRWFMMDSLWLTLTKNLGAENVYYTMEGGKDLAFEELYPINEFPAELPYMGSAFFFGHAGARGDEDENDTNVSVFSEDEAMDILAGALDMAEGTALVSYGEEIVDGVHGWVFAYGKNTPEKFTAEARYAVTDSGKILVYDLAGDEYIEFKAPNSR